MFQIVGSALHRKFELILGLSVFVSSIGLLCFAIKAHLIAILLLFEFYILLFLPYFYICCYFLLSDTCLIYNKLVRTSTLLAVIAQAPGIFLLIFCRQRFIVFLLDNGVFRCFVELQENLHSRSAMYIMTGIPHPPYFGCRDVMFLSLSVQLNRLLIKAWIESY